MFVGECYFYGVEVLALDILYERHFHYVLIADGADVCRDSCQPRKL
ncbi:Uncharacterised protein [Segatella copri]|nr:Uncharacterised protein [Segatella copri]